MMASSQVKTRLNTTVSEDNLLEMNEEHMLLKEGLEGAVDPLHRDRRGSVNDDQSDSSASTTVPKRSHGRRSSGSGGGGGGGGGRALPARGGGKKRRVNYAERAGNDVGNDDDNDDDDEEEDAMDIRTKRTAAGVGQAGRGGGGAAETEDAETGSGDAGDVEAGLPLASSEFALPRALRVLLEQDMINISQNRKLHTLPKSPSVHQILLKFKEVHTKEEDGQMHTDLRDPVTLEPVTIPALNLVGLRTLFDQALGQCLLYRFERPQFARIKKLGAHLAPCDVYGAEHLMRLTDKLPELIGASGASDDAVLQIGTLLSKIMTFLDEEKDTLITGTYVDVDDAYANKLDV